MTTLALAEAQLITFALVDTNGAAVTGLGTGFSLSVSKNGGAFATGTGTKAEIGSGWYSYELTASETDTAGPLSVKVTGAGAVQQNLSYDVSGSIWTAPAGTYILTATEAANVLRTSETDPDMLALLPIIDSYIRNATGRNWAADTSIHPSAKAAARILLVMWHENPAQQGQLSSLPHGLTACLTQLEALALRYYRFQGLDGAGAVSLPGACAGDSVTSLTGLIGATGDRSADFETVITVDDEIQQSSTSDLSANWYEALLTPLSDL